MQFLHKFDRHEGGDLMGKFRAFFQKLWWLWPATEWRLKRDVRRALAMKAAHLDRARERGKPWLD